MNNIVTIARWLVAVVLAGAAACAAAQPLGHLNVPWSQMVHAGFAPAPGFPANQYYVLNVVRPDGTQDMPGSSYFFKQTLVAMDVTVIVYRPGGALGWPESGEIVIGDVDASLKGRPVQDHWPLVRYTMPANENRLVVRVPLTAGRAFSGGRQPVFVHYGPPGVEINPRVSGYVLPN